MDWLSSAARELETLCQTANQNNTHVVRAKIPLEENPSFMFRCHNVIQFFSCVCLCANYSSVVRVPPDLSFFSNMRKQRKVVCSSIIFCPVHTLVGRRSPTCISLNEEGQGPKGQGLTLGNSFSGAGKKLLT